MLAALLLVAVLGESPGPVATSARAACPVLPSEAFVPSAHECDTFEVTGRIDPGSLSLDPAFDARAPESELARPAPGNASLVAYDVNGRPIFSFPFSAAGPFRLVLPLGRQYAAAVARLTLTASGAAVERLPTFAPEPAAEAVASDDTHAVFAWNARDYPGVRIAEERSGAAVASVTGGQTYQQVFLATRARQLAVSFSNGVRSVTRLVNVFGRR